MRLFRARGFPAGCSGLQWAPVGSSASLPLPGYLRYVGLEPPATASHHRRCPCPWPSFVSTSRRWTNRDVPPQKGPCSPSGLRYRYLRDPVPAQYHVPSIAVNPRLSCLLGPLPKSPPSPITIALALAVADILSSPFPRPIPLLAIPSPALIPSVLHLHLRLPLPSFSLAACAGDWLCSLSLDVCLTQFLSHLSPPHHHSRLLLVSLPCPSMLIAPAASLAGGTWARLFSFVCLTDLKF